MHDEETRKYLQSIKRLITFAQRAYPTTPSLSLDFNSGYNGWDKDSLIEADAKLDIKAQVPALLALPANGDGWKAQDGDTRTWKSLLTHAYEGTEFAKRKGKVDMDKIRTMKDEIIARDKGMYDARSGHLGKGFGERNDERNRG
jgi:pre-mRNA-splicing factor 18